MYRDNCKPPKWREAAQCFRNAGALQDAAGCYMEAWDLDRAMECCYQRARRDIAYGGLDFGTALLEKFEARAKQQVQLLLRGPSALASLGPTPAAGEATHGGGGAEWAKQLGMWQSREKQVGAARAEYVVRCANTLLKRGARRAMMEFVHRFPSADKKRSFLLRRSCFDELLQLELHDGNLPQVSPLLRWVSPSLHFGVPSAARAVSSALVGTPSPACAALGGMAM